MEIGNKRTISKWAFFWLVNFSRTDGRSYFVFCERYYEDQEFKMWNDWQEGVGNHWKTSWQCVSQYKHK